MRCVTSVAATTKIRIKEKNEWQVGARAKATLGRSNDD